MSQLDQAKKEAKRLFNLAKSQSPDENRIHLNIQNLSAAREHIAMINGSKNWHELEQNLKRKDAVFSNIDKTTENKEAKQIEKNLTYFLQEKSFTHIQSYQAQTQAQFIVEKPHQPIVLAYTKKKKILQEKKSVIATQYPMMLSGSTGAGTTETILSFCAQYIQNKEGVIYFEGRGESVLYSKMFSYLKEAGRLQDLYALNFLGTHKTFDSQDNTYSHSIDPINPMVGDELYFQTFFGEFGSVIHEILMALHAKHEVLSLESLESMLMLHNLIRWQQEAYFGPIQALGLYLNKIGLDTTQNEYSEEELSEALEKHATLAHRAYKMLSIFAQYPHVFKYNCSVSIERIFLERKVLVILMPALEKSIDDLSLLGGLLAYQIVHFDKKFQPYNLHFQNIILGDFSYYMQNNGQYLSNIISKSKNNYIFHTYDYSYDKQEFFASVLSNIKTFIVMKMESFYLPDKIRMDMLDYMKEVPPLFYVGRTRIAVEQWRPLNEQREGEATIIMNSLDYSDYEQIIAQLYKEQPIFNRPQTYQVENVLCIYTPAPKQAKYYLVPQASTQSYLIETKKSD